MHRCLVLAAAALCATAHAQTPSLAWSTLPGGVSISTDAAEHVFTATWDFNPAGDILVTKRNSAGTALYTARFDNTDPTRHEVATWVQADGSGGVYVSGTIRSGFSNPVDVNGLLMRFGADGSLLWRRVFGTDFDGGRALRVVADAAGNAYVMGIGNGPAGLRTTVRKLSPQGDELWTWTDPSGIGSPVHLKLAEGGDLLLAAFGPTGLNAGFARIGPDGQTRWARVQGQVAAVGDLAGDASGTSYLAFVDAATQRGKLLKVDAAGFTPWSRDDAIQFNRVELRADGEPVASGYHPAFPFGLGMARFGTDGTLRWANRDADGPAHALLMPGMLKLDAQGNAYVVATDLSQIGVVRVQADGSAGWTLLAPFGSGGTLALGAQGRLYVTAGQTSRIDQEGTPPPPAADLAVAVSDAPDPVRPGSPLVLTTTVRNVGTAPAAAVVLNQTFSANVVGVSATTTQGSCSGVRPLVCTLGTLAAGGTVTVVQTVRPRSAGTLTTTDGVTTTSADPVSSNNTATTTTTVRRR